MPAPDIRLGDSRDVLPTLPDESIDAVVTDPPYELGFMGKGWDISGVAYDVELWRQCLRVLKPGGHLLAFGGTRTYHRLACAVEDAGFEIRDSITWLYGSGFPKSLDVSKSLDKAAGAQREVVGVADRKASLGSAGVLGSSRFGEVPTITAPATPDAARWAGWGTALKPASEPIVVARKPLAGTVAANVLAHGTGALNIDACRAGSTKNVPASASVPVTGEHGIYNPGWTARAERSGMDPNTGRWPANVVLSHAPGCGEDDGAPCAEGCPVAELDAQSGDRPGFSTQRDITARSGTDGTTTYGAGVGALSSGVRVGFNDSGGASRFFPVFRYQAKAPSRERPRVNGVSHPTVKPLALMRWLVRLVTPPGGTVLDLFAGSGTTVEAALAEGFGCIAVEAEVDYLPLITARLSR